MSEFENVLDEYKEQTKPMCEALGCLDLLDDYLVDIELSRAKYHHFYQAGQQSHQAKIDEVQRVIDIYEDGDIDSLSDFVRYVKQALRGNQ